MKMKDVIAYWVGFGFISSIILFGLKDKPEITSRSSDDLFPIIVFSVIIGFIVTFIRLTKKFNSKLNLYWKNAFQLVLPIFSLLAAAGVATKVVEGTVVEYLAGTLVATGMAGGVVAVAAAGAGLGVSGGAVAGMLVGSFIGVVSLGIVLGRVGDGALQTIYILLAFSILLFNRFEIIKPAKYPGLSVSQIMLKRKVLNNNVSIILLALAIVGYVYTCNKLEIEIFTNPGFWILAALAIISTINQAALYYRVNYGYAIGDKVQVYYGTNEYEAREIIGFMLDNAKEVDFTDGGKRKRISDMEPAKAEVPVEIPDGVTAPQET